MMMGEDAKKYPFDSQIGYDFLNQMLEEDAKSPFNQ